MPFLKMNGTPGQFVEGSDYTALRVLNDSNDPQVNYQMPYVTDSGVMLFGDTWFESGGILVNSFDGDSFAFQIRQGSPLPSTPQDGQIMLATTATTRGYTLLYYTSGNTDRISSLQFRRYDNFISSKTLSQEVFNTLPIVISVSLDRANSEINFTITGGDVSGNPITLDSTTDGVFAASNTIPDSPDNRSGIGGGTGGDISNLANKIEWISDGEIPPIDDEADPITLQDGESALSNAVTRTPSESISGIDSGASFNFSRVNQDSGMNAGLEFSTDGGANWSLPSDSGTVVFVPAQTLVRGYGINGDDALDPKQAFFTVAGQGVDFTLRVESPEIQMSVPPTIAEGETIDLFFINALEAPDSVTLGTTELITNYETALTVNAADTLQANASLAADIKTTNLFYGTLEITATFPNQADAVETIELLLPADTKQQIFEAGVTAEWLPSVTPITEGSGIRYRSNGTHDVNVKPNGEVEFYELDGNGDPVLMTTGTYGLVFSLYDVSDGTWGAEETNNLVLTGEVDNRPTPIPAQVIEDQDALEVTILGPFTVEGPAGISGMVYVMPSGMQMSVDAGGGFGAPSSASQTMELGYQFRLHVTSPASFGSFTVYSFDQGGAFTTVRSETREPIAPINNQPLSSQTITEGQDATYSIDIDESDGPIVIVWFYKGVRVDGEDGETLVLENIPLSDNGSEVSVSLFRDGLQEVDAAVLNVLSEVAGPAISVQPQGSTVTEGDQVTIDITADTDTYELQRNGLVVSGVTAPPYVFTSTLANNGDQYRWRLVKDGLELFSNTVTVVVNESTDSVEGAIANLMELTPDAYLFQHDGDEIPRAQSRSTQSSLIYGIDWNGWLQDDESITSSSWSTDAALTLTGEAAGDSFTKVRITGGTLYSTYLVSNTVTATDGSGITRTDVRSFYLPTFIR